MQLLFQLLNKVDKKAGSIDDEEAKDVVNRSYATRMILKHEQSVPLEHVLPTLLAHLPLETGLEENTPILKLSSNYMDLITN